MAVSKNVKSQIFKDWNSGKFHNANFSGESDGSVTLEYFNIPDAINDEAQVLISFENLCELESFFTGLSIKLNFISGQGFSIVESQIDENESLMRNYQ